MRFFESLTDLERVSHEKQLRRHFERVLLKYEVDQKNLLGRQLASDALVLNLKLS